MKKIIIGVVIVVGLVFVFTAFSGRSDRGYHREGLISSFTNSAVRGAGSYTGYRAAKHVIDKFSGNSHHSREHSYSR